MEGRRNGDPMSEIFKRRREFFGARAAPIPNAVHGMPHNLRQIAVAEDPLLPSISHHGVVDADGDGGGVVAAPAAGEPSISHHGAVDADGGGGGGGVVAAPAAGGAVKRKRGRPRKYGPPETANRGRGPPPGTSNLHLLASPERLAVGLAGNGFHVITVAPGEFIVAKVRAFLQQGGLCNVCVLTANGSVSKAILRHPSATGRNVTYEGQYNILSLSGSYLHPGDGGWLNVFLLRTDGQIIGGPVGGILQASSYVQVVVASFGCDGSGAKAKRQRIEERSSVPKMEEDQQKRVDDGEEGDDKEGDGEEG